jgi:hypothetical protein
MVDGRLNVIHVSILPGITAEPAQVAGRRMEFGLPDAGKAIPAVGSAAVGS